MHGATGKVVRGGSVECIGLDACTARTDCLPLLYVWDIPVQYTVRMTLKQEKCCHSYTCMYICIGLFASHSVDIGIAK